MQIELQYGFEKALTLNVPDDRLVAHRRRGAHNGIARADVREAVFDALDDPLNYPPLSETCMSGDRVAIVPDAGLPFGKEVVASVCAYVMEHGVAADRIAVLLAKHDEPSLGGALPKGVRTVVHDPSKEGECTILGTAESGEPIALNRTMIDADVVLPIGCFRGRLSAGYFGMHNVLYPRFSDAESQHAFRSMKLVEDTRGREVRRLAKLVDDVAWRLGLMFTIHAVPADGGRIAYLAAGETKTVQTECNRVYRRAWEVKAAKRPSLVVATVDASDARRAWDDFASALAAASSIAGAEAEIAVCCSLEALPEEGGVAMMGRTSPWEESLERLEHEPPADAITAFRIADAVRRHRVYLLSDLPSDTTEHLDMLPIAGADELNRIVARHEAVAVLENGHLASGVVS